AGPRPQGDEGDRGRSRAEFHQPRSEEADGGVGREAEPSRPQERQGLLRLSREGQGPEEPVAGPGRTAAEEARSRYARRRGAEAALPGGAGGGSRAHRRG